MICAFIVYIIHHGFWGWKGLMIKYIKEYVYRMLYCTMQL